MLHTGPISLAREPNFQTREPATVRFRRTPQRFVPSDLVTSPSRFHARDVTRNPVLLDSAASNGVVDDLTAHTLNKLSDAFPTHCPSCGQPVPWHLAECPDLSRGPWGAEPSNMRVAAVHPHHKNTGDDGCREPEKLTS